MWDSLRVGVLENNSITSFGDRIPVYPLADRLIGRPSQHSKSVICHRTDGVGIWCKHDIAMCTLVTGYALGVDQMLRAIDITLPTGMVYMAIHN